MGQVEGVIQSKAEGVNGKDCYLSRHLKVHR